jgi:DNA-directed RNA polymerase subunit RPC12/RpoP
MITIAEQSLQRASLPAIDPDHRELPAGTHAPHENPQMTYVCAYCGGEIFWCLPQQTHEEPLRICAYCGGERFWYLPR